jgi:hypothetical protein
MRLTLTVGGKELASIPIDATKANNHAYLQAKRRLLKTVHHTTLRTQAESPVFYLNGASVLNRAARE